MKDNSKIIKKQRHECVLKLISENLIETQGQLTNALIANGFDVTQATVSRDIKELRLIKIANAYGSYHYSLPDDESDTNKMVRYSMVLKHATIFIKPVQNLVVIKTLPGSAQGCAMAIEVLKINNVVGMIAGDDTIFIAADDNEAALSISEHIESIIERGI